MKVKDVQNLIDFYINCPFLSDETKQNMIFNLL